MFSLFKDLTILFASHLLQAAVLFGRKALSTPIFSFSFVPHLRTKFRSGLMCETVISEHRSIQPPKSSGAKTSFDVFATALQRFTAISNAKSADVCFRRSVEGFVSF